MVFKGRIGYSSAPSIPDRAVLILLVTITEVSA